MAEGIFCLENEDGARLVRDENDAICWQKYWREGDAAFFVRIDNVPYFKSLKPATQVIMVTMCGADFIEFFRGTDLNKLRLVQVEKVEDVDPPRRQ